MNNFNSNEPKLKRIGNDWVILIPRNLHLEIVKEEIDKKNGIKRVWGKAEEDKFKLVQIYYPISNYSLDDMTKILKKYDSCKLCRIGKKNLKFINEKRNIKSMSLENYKMKERSVVDLLGKLPRIGSKITGNREISEKWIMQSLATITRLPVDLYAQTLFKKIISLSVGIGGTALVAKLIKDSNVRSEWLEFFANWGANVFDPTPEQLNELAANINQLKSAVRNRSFYGVKSSLLKDPKQVSQAIKNITGAIGLGSFGNKFGKISDMIRGFARPRGGGRVRISEGTGAAGKGSIALQKGFRSSPKMASDYGYIDTSRRFRDVSKFSKGFVSDRRFRQSGVNQG